MPSPTKAELLAENRKFARRIAALERAKQKDAAASPEIKRLRAELRAAEQRQAATAKILEVIASSPVDVQPVFKAIAESSMRLLGGRSGVVTRVSGADLELVAFTSTGDKGDDVLKAVHSLPLSDASDIHCRVVRSAHPEFRADTEKDSKVTPEGRAMARARGFRSVLSVPMIRDGVAIGTIGVTRARAGAFSVHEIGLMTTFARQAVIAIENVRMFNETKQALERQTATAEILRVISSSPTDTQPVFDAIARSGARLVDGMNLAILLRQGAEVVVAGYSAPGREDLPEEVRKLPLDREKNFPSRVILDGEILQIPDWEGDDIPEFERSVARAYGVKAGLQVPMLRNGEGIGVIVVSRATTGAFDAKDIALLKSFADQAVIAIENVRLFNETKEALERQTATAEILKVIASSPSDVQPVFDAIAERAAALCAAKFAYLTTFDGELVHLQATYGPGSDEHRARYPLKPGSHSIGTRVVRDGAPVCVEDVLADAEYSHKAEAAATGYRSGFGVPMMRDGRVIGAISLARPDPGQVPEKLIHLLQTFADQAVIAIENVRLFNETQEALERQTATADVLAVISNSPTDLRPVFDAVLRNATSLCGAHLGILNLYDGERFLTGAQCGGNPEFVKWLFERGPWASVPGSVIERMLVERQPIQVLDARESAAYKEGGPITVKMVDVGGARTFLTVPLLKEGRVIGNLGIYRPEVLAFTDRQIDLVRTFADQAVIAIENARLFNETREALERQTATAEILKVIARSPSDVQPVFDAIAESAMRLLGCLAASVTRVVGEEIQLAALTFTSEEGVAGHRSMFPIPLSSPGVFAEVARKGVPAMRIDFQAEPGVPAAARELAQVVGYRSGLFVPMLREGVAIGTINVARKEPGAFSPYQVSLLETFADQAVIAIENVRLFNETKEALERQTATAEILKVIASSPADVQPALDAIAKSAAELFAPCVTGIVMREADQLFLRCIDGPAHADMKALAKVYPMPFDPDASIVARAIVSGSVVETLDTEAPDSSDLAKAAGRAIGFRSFTVAPLLRSGGGIGAISICGPQAGFRLSDKQLSLLRTLADQAVIAIENVRLFNETKEALERQTATSDVLQVISTSPNDLRPVFDAVLRNATSLCDAHLGILNLFDGEKFVTGAQLGGSPEFAKWLFERGAWSPAGQPALERMIAERQPVQVLDAKASASYREGNPVAVKWIDVGGARTFLYVPLIRDGKVIGNIGVYRPKVLEFTPRQIALVKTFADQAAIAIENVRLFNETKEALERQTATAEILRVISRSQAEVRSVFEAISESSMRLFSAWSTAVFSYDGKQLHFEAARGALPDSEQVLRDQFPRRPVADFSPADWCVLESADMQIADCWADPRPEYSARAHARGYRSLVVVPMLRDGVSIGVIAVSRKEAGGFAVPEVELLKTFADQAVIAIENVRLFNETKEALEQQTATAEILKVMGSSPTNTSPVFEAIANSALRIFNGKGVAVVLVDGNEVESVVEVGNVPNPQPNFRMPLTRDSTSGRAILDRTVINFRDTEAPDAPPYARANGRARGVRSIAGAPMLRNGVGIGAIVVSGENPGGLSEKHVELLQTFADQAVIAIENVRLFNETKESLERQTATAEILRVIAGSPSDVQPVFNAIAESSNRLIGGFSTAVGQVFNEALHLVAFTSTDVSGDEALKSVFPMPLSSPSAAIRAIHTRQVSTIGDSETSPEMSPRMREVARVRGWRSALFVPLIRDNAAIGVISITRRGPGEFGGHQVDLIRSFADQAVIAIENVRLFNETKESLERQTATAEILKVISGSPTDVQPVFDAIVNSAARLFEPCDAVITMRAGDQIRLDAHAGPTWGSAARSAALRNIYPIPFDSARSNSARAIVERRVIEVPDTEAPGVLDVAREIARAVKFRSVVTVPLLREDEGIGTIALTHPEPGFKLTDKQLVLIRTFADQAVIAIENVRLFNETKEALEQQTTTAEILKVIGSSPTDTRPVFDAIVKAALRIFDGMGVNVLLLDGNELQLVASGGNIATRIGFRMPLDLESPAGRALAGRCAIMVPDTEAPDAPARARENGRFSGFRSITAAPMFREGAAVGAITVIRRDTGTLSDKQMALLQTFADQAVIAIENVRLFKELEARTAALSQSVGQLTALGEVGQAISSTLDLDTVLMTIVSRALQLTGLDGGSMYEYDERTEVFRMQVSENMAEELVQVTRNTPIRLGDGAVGRAGVTREPVQVPDTLDDSYQSERKELLIRSGYRAVLAVPLVREDNLLGALLVTRKTPGAFAPEVVDLLKTFATQSAMAIQNARLFREIAEKGKQLEIASHHKSDFLASMSHELRTPLNAILGFNELILAEIYGTVPEEMKEPLTDIQTSGKHLLRLINNVLDLAKIEAGRMELALAEYSVHDTVESVRSTLRPLAAEKGLEFLATVPEDIPIAYGDFGRITQCLMNLAGNSLKFTKVGKVEIVVGLNGDILIYRVIDTGIGIPPDKIGSLFTEFKQTDATIASEYGGTGLGLSISRKFIEMHGGRVWVESEVGKGSSFIFEVPLRVDASRGAES